MVAVEETLNAERARVERFERDIAAEPIGENSNWLNIGRRVRKRADCWPKIESRLRSYIQK